jgi:hypothetical protein
MDVEREEFGTFPGGFGDNGPYDGVEGDQGREIDYFITQADNLDFATVLEKPTNGLVDTAATLADSIPTQLPLNTLRTNTDEASTQQRELNPLHYSTTPNSLATGDLTSLNGELLDSLLSDNEWPLDMLFEPTFPTNTGSTQLLYNNCVSLSQFQGQNHPRAENGGFEFIQ